MDRDLVGALRDRDVDVTTAADMGMWRRKDEEMLERAVSEGRVLYSANVADFARIHAEWVAAEKEHAGLIVVQQQRFSVGEQMRRILTLAGDLSAEAMRNRLEYLGNWG
ncbi:MAG: DUF5615 family PIN-like protein [Planctomycetes bacterium]|nr:DUF5615 family PIN-like protein [Planctomycetota bacterium]